MADWPIKMVIFHSKLLPEGIVSGQTPSPILYHGYINHTVSYSHLDSSSPLVICSFFFGMGGSLDRDTPNHPFDIFQYWKPRFSWTHGEKRHAQSQHSDPPGHCPAPHSAPRPKSEASCPRGRHSRRVAAPQLPLQIFCCFFKHPLVN
jgi:hypothetical protein